MPKTNFTPEEFTMLDPSPLSSVYAETFIFTPASEEEKNLGSLYIVSEVSSNKTKKENAELVSELVNVIKNEYYKNTIVTPISALRFSLKRANVAIALKKIWLAPAAGLKLKMLATVLKERNLYLAKLGDASAIILRDDNLQNITTPATTKIKTRTDDAWAFENIISGELLAEDSVVLATNQIHKIDEAELAYKLGRGELIEYLSTSNEGIKNLALITLGSNTKTKNNSVATLTTQKKLPPFIHKTTGTPNQPQLPRLYSKNIIHPKKLKLIALALVLITIASVVTTVGLKIKNETAKNKKEADSLVQEVTDLKEKINSLIEVKNETEANQLLNTAQEKLNRLAELGYFKTTRVTLEDELAKTSESISHLEVVQNIRTVANLENNSTNFDPKSLALGKNKILIFSDNKLYKFDLNRNEGNYKSLAKDDVMVSALEKLDDANIAFLATQDKIIMQQGSELEEKIIWARPENQSTIKQAALYNQAFYFLFDDGLIYKLPYETASSTSDIATGDLTLWSNQNQITNYKLQIINMAVEGSIFGLTDEHTIAEFINGEKRNETVLKEAISEIFTLPNQKNIYALSPAEGLIVVIDKNFNIKKRLSRLELREAKSFVVNSQERIIYFLKGKTVYSFEI